MTSNRCGVARAGQFSDGAGQFSDGAGRCVGQYICRSVCQMGQVGVSGGTGQCVRLDRSVCQMGQVSVLYWTGQYVRWGRSVCQMRYGRSVGVVYSGQCVQWVWHQFLCRSLVPSGRSWLSVCTVHVLCPCRAPVCILLPIMGHVVCVL